MSEYAAENKEPRLDEAPLSERLGLIGMRFQAIDRDVRVSDSLEPRPIDAAGMHLGQTLLGRNDKVPSHRILALVVNDLSSPKKTGEASTVQGIMVSSLVVWRSERCIIHAAPEDHNRTRISVIWMVPKHKRGKATLIRSERLFGSHSAPLRIETTRVVIPNAGTHWYPHSLIVRQNRATLERHGR